MLGITDKNKSLKKFFSENDFQAENIPIHTMMRDLESEKNEPSEENQPEVPEGTPTPVDPEPDAGVIKDPSPAAPPPVDRRTSSPFLNAELISDIAKKEPKPRIESVSQNAPEPMADISPDPTSQLRPLFSSKPSAPGDKKEIFINEGEEMPAMPGADPKTAGSGLTKKLILILVALILLVAISAGGYYFWNWRKNSEVKSDAPQDAVSEKQPEPSPENKSSEAPVISSSKFSNTERNFFMIDLGSDSASVFKNLTNNYFEEIKVSGISYPIEFTVIDPGNSTVDFKTFAAKMGLNFSSELLSVLENDFNLYVYNDRGEPGIGLAIRVRSEAVPEEIMLKEEDNLPNELAAIFPPDQYTITKGAGFSTGEYDSARWGKVAIRYQNIPASRNLSVDYSFHNVGKEMLFIGTTRNTLRAIIESAK